ncbi:polysaccharide pyruvyl transferase family protein [Bacillus sp. SRB3LM]|uniref:polysaccharide pyruvyl transferase family protein n=1 Tax=Bacillus sp. SRB3LM TaxID=2608689 RepID=UPI0018C366AB|nr:polysaccharide pyruvyl transferase family protein [Bacillus sp. SRB3LM]MBG0971055.1 polysaccharide pyruvyl transferase family protein [Bacillus sp. SRB3LM]
MILLYLGYLGKNNIGDEVCYEAFIQAINKWGNRKYTILPFPIHEQTSLQNFYNQQNFDAVILGGGSLLQGDFFLTLVEEAQQMEIPVFCYGTGIDYLTEMAIYNYQRNQKIEVNSFFANRNIDFKRILNAIKSMNFIGVRGPLTYQALITQDSNIKNICILGDAAITYTPPDNNFIFQKYLNFKCKPIVAINWGTTFNKLFGYSEQGLLKQVIQCCNYLHSKGYHIVIFPMWDVDITYCKDLYSHLTNLKSVTLIPEVCTAAQIFHFLSACEFSINLKLHANVLSAAALLPFINLAYRSKGMDFSLSVNFQNNTLLTNTSDLLDFVIKKEKEFKNNRNLIVNSLQKFQAHYSKQQKAFFENYLSLY